MSTQTISAHSAPALSAGELLGSEVPRVWTKPLRELTPETSLGYNVIEFAEVQLKIQLFPWQKWLLIHAMELRPNGRLRFRNVIILVARQNGKSLVSVVLSLWAMYVFGVKTVLGTAQDLDTAEEIWQLAVDLVYEEDEESGEPVRPALYKGAPRRGPVMASGKKALVLKTGERYKVKAANRRAGRGLSGDLILLDELREQQNWEAWGAITKTTMARPNAQVWAMSNAGDITSVVLRYLRAKAHAPLGDPDKLKNDRQLAVYATESLVSADEDDLAIFEWSAAPRADRWDREAWAQANPSLGYIIEEATIASAARTDPDQVFRTEVLCQWPSGAVSSVFLDDTWEKSTVKELTDAHVMETPVWAAVDISSDRSHAAVCFAGWLPDGRIAVELVAYKTGTDWLQAWLEERADLIVGITGQTNGAPISKFLDQLRTAHEKGEGEEGYFPIKVYPWKNQDLTGASGLVFDGVKYNRVVHFKQPPLDRAAAMAVPKSAGDSWLFDRTSSPVDIAPIVAFTAAYWACLELEEEEQMSEYETGRLEVV